jgi:MraZ protein
MDDLDGLEDEFLGTYVHALDAKGRLVLPSDHRLLLGGGPLVMTLGFDRTVDIHTLRGWQQLRGSLAQGHRGDLTQRRLARAVFANASKQHLDRQGRVTVPPSLREQCGLRKDVAIVGMGPHIELWDAARWAEEDAASRDTYVNTRDAVGIGNL